MLQKRKSSSRGEIELGWLSSRASFSFGDFIDPAFMNFRALRVINEDYIQPGTGFGTHPHRDMEIITCVLEGEIKHKDTLGSEGVLRAGEVQTMTAGTGIRHSEFNPHGSDVLHLLQIWLLPDREGLAPTYDQRAFAEADKQDALRLIVSGDGRDSSLRINQDTALYASLLSAGESLNHDLENGRYAWIQVASGDISINGTDLSAGDGLAATDENGLSITARSDAEFLLFDLN